MQLFLTANELAEARTRAETFKPAATKAGGPKIE